MLVTGISLKSVLDVVWYRLIRLCLTIKREMAEGVGYLRQTLKQKTSEKSSRVCLGRKIKSLDRSAKIR
jgi:hypothetical protein